MEALASKARGEYIQTTATRGEILEAIMNHSEIAPHIDPERDVDDSGRLKKAELAFVAAALRDDESNPYSRTE